MNHVPDMYNDLGPMFGGMGMVFSAVNHVQYCLWVVWLSLLSGAIKPKGRPLEHRELQIGVPNKIHLFFEHVACTQSGQRNCGLCPRPENNFHNCPNNNSSTPIAGSSSQVLQSEANFLTHYGESVPASQWPGSQGRC